MPRSALIIGGANTLPRDRYAALELFTPDLIIACNHAGRDEHGPVDHWVTMHPELFPHWIAAREAGGHPPAVQLWHARHKQSRVESKPVESWGGSSGMLCIAVAFELGVERIVLAGVPMEKANRHYDDPRPWNEARQYHPAWERRVPQMRGRVKSLSGWTRDLLGEPTEGWLNGDSG